jgi:LEA14-like dessication related protein
LNVPVIILVSLGFYLITGYAKASAAQLLNFSIANAQVDLSGSNFYLTVNVVVQNPTGESFNVKSLSGSLTVNGNFLGTVSNFQPAVIAANSQAIYPLTIQIALIGAGLDLYQIINDGEKDIVANISGTANANGFAIPVNVQAKIF